MENSASKAVTECPVWRNLRNGDAIAFAQVFHENYDSLYYYGKKLAQDEDLVKDCVQNLFLKIWIAHEKLMAVKHVRSYLLKALRRHIGDQVIALKRHKTLQKEFLNEFEITFSHEDFLVATQVSIEQSQALALSLNQLSCRQREAILLKFYEGLNYVKIAEVMELNVQSVRNLIYQGLKIIKKQLTPGTAVFVNVESDPG